ncbi:MAG: hypothetical protein ABSA68_17275 [Xanthobacteraceae bacterium]
MVGKREVRCTNCGALNRVPEYSITKSAKCGRCGAALAELPIVKALQTIYKFRRLTLPALFVAFWAIILVAALWDPVVMGLGCSNHRAPAHGIYARYASAIGGASLTIITQTGSDYFVKLEREPSDIAVMSFFIHGGRPLYASVPTGKFVMKVASGNSWCGESYLFGSGTTMQETGSLVFEEDEAHTVTLTATSAGNLPIHSIPWSRF